MQIWYYFMYNYTVNLCKITFIFSKRYMILHGFTYLLLVIFVYTLFMRDYCIFIHGYFKQFSDSKQYIIISQDRLFLSVFQLFYLFDGIIWIFSYQLIILSFTFRFIVAIAWFEVHGLWGDSQLKNYRCLISVLWWYIVNVFVVRIEMYILFVICIDVKRPSGLLDCICIVDICSHIWYT